MFITHIKVSNFKSFERLDVDLNEFNILIGANASGKSNFIQIFKFLRDIVNYGVDNAISMQGGVEYLRNISVGPSEPLLLEIIFRQPAAGFGIQDIGIKIYEIVYRFSLEFRKRKPPFKIIEDKLTTRCESIALEKQGEKIIEKEKLGEGEITLSNVNGKLKIETNFPDGISPKILKEHLFPPFFREGKFSLLLRSPLPFLWGISPSIFETTSIYDIDPKLPKKAVPISGKAELEEDGSNLAIVLKNITENKESQRKFSNLIRDLLPFVKNWDVEKFADKSLLFKLEEKYFSDQYIPASLISDGTINLTALIIALYFDQKPLTIIEEPEKNIHPYLMFKVVDMMRDASQHKQIIVTTHSAELVKHADLKDILLVSRNKEGFSVISRPYQQEEVQVFLEHDIGFEELYAQNLLEG
jgi:predicted ATPase